MSLLDYDNIKEIGDGTYGKVFVGYDKIRKKEVALKYIKILKPGVIGSSITKIEEEIQIQKTLSDIKGCCKYYDNFKAIHNGAEIMCIVMEYINGETLDDFIANLIKPVSFNKLISIIKQLTKIVALIHEKGYAHRDIKPANIIINKNNKIRLIDFGLTCTEVCVAGIGSVLWSSPENFLENGEIPIEKAKSHDIWSIGIIMYQLTNLKFPFNINGNFSEVSENIVYDDISLSEYPNAQINILINSILEKNWKKRFSAVEILENINKIEI